MWNASLKSGKSGKSGNPGPAGHDYLPDSICRERYGPNDQHVAVASYYVAAQYCYYLDVLARDHHGGADRTSTRQSGSFFHGYDHPEPEYDGNVHVCRDFFHAQ